ncbi:F-box protein SKIP23 [Rhynchospora pubera]|uniref:F-box protein SKIP23 n=1 Tax=Rhynchospora pubera TaxID=906938 RepID=A0AAV8END4_9POAL|nr:F-box protein SKIP23 [Rhynchospora pubera]
MGNWEDLPTDLIITISTHITRNADYIRFRAACSSWRSATDARPHHLPRQIPFLLLSGDAFTFYSPTEDRSYFVPFPSGSHYHFLGSSHGWLFLVGPTTSLILLNPFARTMITLPPVVEIPNLFDQVTPNDVERYRASMSRGDGAVTVGFWKYLLNKGKLCLDSGSPGFWIAVAFLKSGLAFYRAGDKTWSHAGRYWQFADAELYNGKLYAITRGGILSTIDVAGSFKEAVVVSSSPLSFSQDISFYLVASAPDLLLVVRKHSDTDGYRKTVGFEVFKLENGDQGWTRVDKLGDRIIFLERGTSVSLPASGLEGCERGCIYFTQGYEPYEEDKGMEIGCYALEGNYTRHLLCCHPDAKSTCWVAPKWITPCLW